MVGLSAQQEERAKRLHGEAVIFNAHNDIMYDVVEQRSRGSREVVRQRHLPNIRAGNVTVSVETVGGDSVHRYTFPRNAVTQMHNHLFPLKRALHTLDAMLLEEAEAGGEFLIVRGAGDIARAKAEGKIAFVLSLEGGMPLEDDIAVLRTLYRLGVRWVGLTWNNRNQLGDGATERSGGGLTHLGIEYVKEMGRLGMVVDVSHLNEAGFWDVAKHCEGPFVASHSNLQGICKHHRNLSDDMIKAIAEHRGVIGINGLNYFITGRKDATVDDLLKHVDHVVRTAGIDYVGLGLDLLESWPKEEYESIWGEFDVLKYPTGLNTLAELINVTRGLVARSYSDEDIRKILGGNFQRVIGAVVGP